MFVPDVPSILVILGLFFILPIAGVAALISLFAREKLKHLVFTAVAGCAAGCAAMYWMASWVCTPEAPHFPCTDPPPPRAYVMVFFGAVFVAAVLAWCASAFAGQKAKHRRDIA
jgi:uncharacterized membrane-anchored protein